MNNKTYYKMNSNVIPQINLINIANIEPPYIHFKRKADEFIMYYIISGEMYLEENSIKYILKPGDIIILDPNYEHFGIKSSKCTYAYIHFTHSDILESYDYLETLKPILLSERISSLSITPFKESPNIILPKYFHSNNNVFNSTLLYDINKIIRSSKNKLEHYLLQGNCMFLELLINISREFVTYLLSDSSIKTLKSQKIIQDLLSFFNEYYYKKETLKPILLSERISSLSITPFKESPNIILPKYFHSNNNVFNSTLLYDINKIIRSSKNKLEHYLLQGNCMFLELLINISREFVTYLLSDSSIKTLKSQKIIQDLLSFFNEYYYKKITSNFLEIQYNCNFDYINRVFKETTGKTIFVYLNELRISQAKLLFNTGSFKVSEVSEKVGFQDSYYFCKVFKKYTGVTPSNYIKNINI